MSTGSRPVNRYAQEAEKLFEDVIDRDIELEFYKDAYLDLLYLYGVHVKAGTHDKAMKISGRVLEKSALAEVGLELILKLQPVRAAFPSAAAITIAASERTTSNGVTHVPT